MLSREKFAEFLHHLRKVVPTYAPDLDDPKTIELWHQAFSTRNIEELRNVYVFVRDNEPHFPSIVRLRQLMDARDKGSRFDELIKLISKHGGYNPPEVEDVMARSINRMGGWKSICEWTNDDLPFRRKEFDEIYKELSEQRKLGALDQSRPATLQGIHQSATSYTLKSPAKLELAPPPKDPEPTEKERVEAHWDRLREKWGDDLDPHVLPHVKAKRFFKLKSDPEYYYRYPSGQDPMSDKSWPYKYVDVDQHREKARERQSRMQSQSDPTQFDASRYSVDKFKD